MAITAAPLSEMASLARRAFDSVASFDVALDEAFLRDVPALLRPTGRLITVDSRPRYPGSCCTSHAMISTF
ncbi:MAG: hypothetical protein L6Q98_00465 [Anaerolineae bacterium]|nr:hypothetical protein [Anaerolineae bacterium]NUQ06686.1 hypothetical protein [Anaerolineae bacterium]